VSWPHKNGLIHGDDPDRTEAAMMVLRAVRPLFCAAVALALCCASCGESGSNPTLYPEVRFQVQPVGGQATYSVDKLTAGRMQYTSLATIQFNATGIFNYLIEQAPGPYSGQFTQIGSTPVKVTLIFAEGNGIYFTASATTSDANPTVVVASGPPSPETPLIPNPEVRFDVCSPSANEPTCETTGDPPGRFGVPFGGTLGDFFTTHLLGQPTPQDPPTASPSIYFLQNPRDQVSGVFRANDESLLVARLIINGSVKQVGSNTNQDVVLKSDI
jgi:hypothetical protein